MGLVFDPTAMFAHDIVPPPETEQEELLLAKLLSVIVPDTDNVTDGLTVNVPVEPVKIIFAQADAVVTVIVWPADMLTLSPATGNEALPHVAGEFQLPDVTEV